MVLTQYLSTTVYRYYGKQIIQKITAAFTRRSAIILEVDFRDPKTLTEVDMEVRTAV